MDNDFFYEDLKKDLAKKNIIIDIDSMEHLVKNDVLINDMHMDNNLINDDLIDDNLINDDLLNDNNKFNMNDNLLNDNNKLDVDNNVKILSHNKLKNTTSYNTLIQIGIKKDKLLVWKENIKNAILEDIVVKNNDKNKKIIPDKNTVKKYFETDDFYIVDGVFIIKDNKKWLNDGMPAMSNFGDSGHMYYFKDLDDVLIDNLSHAERYKYKIKEREQLDIEQELFTKVLENKTYANYNNDIIETNDNFLLEEKLEEQLLKMGSTRQIKNRVQILKDIQTHKENIKNNKNTEQGKMLIEQTRNETIRKLINYINEKKELK